MAIWGTILGMVSDPGLRAIAQVVRGEMERRNLRERELADNARVSRPTITRIKAGNRLSDVMYRAVGDALGLPRDYLLYVGNLDIGRIRAAAVHDPDLLRWTLDIIDTEAGNPEQPRLASSKRRISHRKPA